MAKYYREARNYGIKKERWKEYAYDKLHYDFEKCLRGLEAKLNTITSSRGDTAFVTFSFGCIDNEREDYNMMQADICKYLLQTRINGHGRGKAPAVFPKLVYLYASKNHTKDYQKEVFELALKCSSRCMYPDFLSLDAGEVGDIYQRTGKAVSPMGCRAFLSDYKDENGESYFTGRANIGAVSLNLPMIWKKSDGKDFWKDLDYYLEMIREFHKKRYEYIADMPASTNPLCFCEGGIHGGNKKPWEKIGIDLLRQFTASFGITALNELNVLMEGKPLHLSDRRKVNEVVDYILAKINQFKKDDGFSYALYGTPAESLCGTQLKQFRKMFGVIEGVSDHEYFTNSFHCHVSADITPFEKQDNEYELFHKCNGGHIQYVKMNNPDNIDALREVILRGMKMGFYQGINFSDITCMDCGWHASKPVEECLVCKSKNLLRIERCCGYLSIHSYRGDTRLNDAKLCEIADRISM